MVTLYSSNDLEMKVLVCLDKLQRPSWNTDENFQSFIVGMIYAEKRSWAIEMRFNMVAFIAVTPKVDIF